MTRQLGVEYSEALDYFTACGKNRQPKVPDETDRTEFLTRFGQ